LDSYNTCSFDCPFCFTKSRGGDYKRNLKLKRLNPNFVENQLEKASNGIEDSVVTEFLKQKIPIHFGGISDPFSKFEEKEKITKKILKILNKFQYPVIISTRSRLIQNPGYLSLLGEGQYIVQFSIDPNLYSRPTLNFFYEQLILDIQSLKEKGIKVVARLQPFLPDREFFYVRLINDLAEIGVCHFAIEHLKLPIDNKKYIYRLNNYAGYDIYKYYRSKNSTVSGRELVLPSQKKLQNINSILNEINHKNLSIGYADNDLMHLNIHNCCIGSLENIKQFSKKYKFTITNAITKRENGEISLKNISDEWHPRKSISRIINSKSRIEGSNISIKDYMLKHWNNSTNLSPNNYFGVQKTNKFDCDGNLLFYCDTDICK
jgi:DNA repair photolyase